MIHENLGHLQLMLYSGYEVDNAALDIECMISKSVSHCEYISIPLSGLSFTVVMCKILFFFYLCRLECPAKATKSVYLLKQSFDGFV